METKLIRIAEIAKENRNMKFTSLIHLLNEESLKQCHRELPKGKAPGIRKLTKEKYEENLGENIKDLMTRMKKKSYRPLPVQRMYIDKPGTLKKRPLGLPDHEDKIVQRGISKILNAIYEQEFLDSSFGFRPKRSCHDALKILNYYIQSRRISYIVDADIKGFFDNVEHEWMMKFLQHRIVDPNFLQLIHRFLKAGYMEDGKRYNSELGTPQGGVISPILANIYLHYVLDLWFERKVKKNIKGEAYMVRYADDFVVCFQYKEDAERFYIGLKQRLSEFNLEIEESKSKIIEFGRFAEQNKNRKGGGKPPTFDFLGFTHYCSKGNNGKFRVKRKTSKKKMNAKLKEAKEWLKINRNQNIHDIFLRFRRSLVGYYNYYGITDNSKSISKFKHQIVLLLYKWLNRRSQRKSFSWEKFKLFLKQNPLPRPIIKVSIYELKPTIRYIL